MAALRISKSLRPKCCLISAGLRSSQLPSLQAAHRTYCSPAKGTSESYKDLKDKPIRFSTSKARRLTLNQTLGDMNEKTSNRPIYIGFITMVILTYIIFFLPASKEEVEEWELLEDAEISKQQDIKRQ
ncbi:uncharacterized protein LOC110046404 [Orbicella faveolata]|uniref:uncharacterized protein LOC110046404 n=1 Tax=Orbicella faveolata TaxID=48498 RepID=UPI0009E546FA|nr:uncharacterized protein LOC110046404 [Orbicella faveolata]